VLLRSTDQRYGRRPTT
ncbi:SIS domain protein, partial [Vibrio parahaemolyticus V-223/04]